MHFSRKLYTRHQISSLSVLCFYWKINFPPSCVVVYCQRQRACCNCVHEPLGESLSVSSSGDAGFTRSAIIGKPEKKAKGVRGRGIDTASHIFSCERLDIRKEISGLPREPPHAESTVPLNYGHVWERLSCRLFGTRQKRMRIGQNNVVASQEGKTHRNSALLRLPLSPFS